MNNVDTVEFDAMIKKLKFYIENEELEVKSIKESLSLLKKYYISNNDDVINAKIENINMSLEVLIENKKNIIDYLTSKLNEIIKVNEEANESFRKIDLSL
ncbi:MAG: hypothetical protein ACI31S_03310 [Bacilli bacterium]